MTRLVIDDHLALYTLTGKLDWPADIERPLLTSTAFEHRFRDALSTDPPGATSYNKALVALGVDIDDVIGVVRSRAYEPLGLRVVEGSEIDKMVDVLRSKHHHNRLQAASIAIARYHSATVAVSAANAYDRRSSQIGRPSTYVRELIAAGVPVVICLLERAPSLTWRVVTADAPPSWLTT